MSQLISTIRLALLVLTACGITASGIAHAQTYPSRPVRLVVPTSPGGGTDFSARAIAPKLGEILRQSVVVENRAGGSTKIGTQALLRAEPDGHTLLLLGHVALMSYYYSGTYDSKVCNVCEKKDEIKTAWQGSNGSFQHESLRAGGCDQHVFVDVAPNYYYITVLATFDMTQRHPVIGRKPHLRRGTTNVYKFDFGESNLKKSIDAGLTIKVDKSTSMEQVAEFIKKFH